LEALLFDSGHILRERLGDVEAKPARCTSVRLLQEPALSGAEGVGGDVAQVAQPDA
jgi:hypothetical protein